jgi:hypothetical protein
MDNHRLKHIIQEIQKKEGVGLGCFAVLHRFIKWEQETNPSLAWVGGMRPAVRFWLSQIFEVNLCCETYVED